MEIQVENQRMARIGRARMRTQMPTVIRFWGKRLGAIPIDVCYGAIPDIFRTSRFDPTSDFELPDAKDTDYNFDHWLFMYRKARPNSARILLGWMKCD